MTRGELGSRQLAHLFGLTSRFVTFF